MITDNIDPVIIGVLGGLLGTLGALSIALMADGYRIYKEKQLEFLKRQIEELLLPLFIKMNRLESRMEFNRDFEVTWEMIIEDDVDIEKIAIEKLNLASPTLSKLLLDFINYRYLNDKSMGIRYIKTDTVENNFMNLKQKVFEDYEQKVKEYQNMKQWWQRSK